LVLCYFAIFPSSLLVAFLTFINWCVRFYAAFKWILTRHICAIFIQKKHWFCTLLLCHHYFIILLCVNNIIRDVSCCFFSSFHCYHYGIICRYFTFLFYKLINKRHNLRQFIILFVINNALRYQMVVFDVICCCFRLFDGISGCFDGVSGCSLIWLSVHLSVRVCMSVCVSFHTLIQEMNAGTISNQFNSIFFIELIEIILRS
jgi:hypothetical protein